MMVGEMQILNNFFWSNIFGSVLLALTCLGIANKYRHRDKSMQVCGVRFYSPFKVLH